MASEENEETTKLDIKVEVKDAGPALKEISIEVPESVISDMIEANFGRLKSDAVIPGFRKGRAPKRLLEKRFSKTIRQEVKGQVLSESYTQAIEDNDLDVLGNPDVKDGDKIELPESGPLNFTVTVEVTPDVTLPSTEGIEINKPSAEVTDEKIDKELNSYCERAGKMEDVENATVSEKDYVQADIKILAGEKAGDDAEVLNHVPEGFILVHGEDFDFKGHAAGIVIEGLGKKIAGKKVGDNLTISMTGPESHEDEKIKNQPITITIDIQKVQRLIPAELEALPALLGMETVEQIKEQLRNMLEQRAQREQQVAMHKQVANYLDTNVDLELPEGLTARQSHRLLNRQANELQYRGVSTEDIQGKLAELRGASEADARKQLKMFFILDKLARELEIEVDEQEINGRIAMTALEQGRRPEKLRQEMQRNGQIENLFLSIREQKTLDKVIETAKITEVDEIKEDDTKPAAKKKAAKKKTTKKKAAKKKAAPTKTEDK